MRMAQKADRTILALGGFVNDITISDVIGFAFLGLVSAAAAYLALRKTGSKKR